MQPSDISLCLVIALRRRLETNFCPLCRQLYINGNIFADIIILCTFWYDKIKLETCFATSSCAGVSLKWVSGPCFGSAFHFRPVEVMNIKATCCPEVNNRCLVTQTELWICGPLADFHLVNGSHVLMENYSFTISSRLDPAAMGCFWLRRVFRLLHMDVTLPGFNVNIKPTRECAVCPPSAFTHDCSLLTHELYTDWHTDTLDTVASHCGYVLLLFSCMFDGSVYRVCVYLQLSTAWCIVLAGTLCSSRCQPDGKTALHTHQQSSVSVYDSFSTTREITLFIFFMSCAANRRSDFLLPCPLMTPESVAVHCGQRSDSVLVGHHRCSTLCKHERWTLLFWNVIIVSSWSFLRTLALVNSLKLDFRL